MPKKSSEPKRPKKTHPPKFAIGQAVTTSKRTFVKNPAWPGKFLCILPGTAWEVKDIDDDGTIKRRRYSLVSLDCYCTKREYQLRPITEKK